jgi:hypothetical protein
VKTSRKWLAQPEREEERRTALGHRFQVSRPVGGGDFSAGFDGRLDIAGYDLYDTEQRVRPLVIPDLDVMVNGKPIRASFHILGASIELPGFGAVADLEL